MGRTKLQDSSYATTVPTAKLRHIRIGIINNRVKKRVRFIERASLLIACLRSEYIIVIHYCPLKTKEAANRQYPMQN